jgi:quercetin dioxygenase-like cupin family protein
MNLANTSQSEMAPTKQDMIEGLKGQMIQMPQAPAMVTNHFFAGGMYCRRMEIPKDRIIVSKVHKTEHFFIGCSGELHVSGQGEDFIVRPGDIIPSPIGTRRAVYSLTDVVVLTVHRTDVTSVDEIEAELIEDGLSLYDVNNCPKPGVTVSLLEDI